MRELPLLAVVVALGAVLSVATDSFLTWQNLFDILNSYAFLGILAAGLTVVLISGGIDISFTATASVAQYVAVSWIIAWGGNWLVVFAVAAAVGIALGLVNALLIHHLRVSSIIITIATLNVFYGLLIFVTHGDYLYTLPDWFADGAALLTVPVGDGYALTVQIAALALTFLAVWLLLARTALGRQIYAFGGNPEAARRMGVRILALHLVVYGLMGGLAGVASVIQAQLAQSVAPTVLVGKELDVVAAVVLGGASLSGGVGSIPGTLLGVALLALMQNGLILVGVSSYWSQLFVGLVILASVVATARAGRPRRGAVHAAG